MLASIAVSLGAAAIAGCGYIVGLGDYGVRGGGESDGAASEGGVGVSCGKGPSCSPGEVCCWPHVVDAGGSCTDPTGCPPQTSFPCNQREICTNSYGPSAECCGSWYDGNPKSYAVAYSICEVSGCSGAEVTICLPPPAPDTCGSLNCKPLNFPVGYWACQ